MIIRKPPEVDFAKDKIVCLTAGGSRDAVLNEVARLRLQRLACPPSILPLLAKEFLIARPRLRNPLVKTKPFAAAAEKIRAAVVARKKIVLYGDYDCDGVTSVALLNDFLHAAGLPASKCTTFIPLRHIHGYGLTMPALQRCVKSHAPELLIVLDCGTNSHAEIQWLTAHGIDSVVVDHHLPAEQKTADTVLLNPKAWVESEHGNWDLKLLCAAGLAFLLVQGMATELDLEAWDESRAILLAGLATSVDMMPVVGLSRILLKNSLWQAQKAGGLDKVPGLAALERLRQSNKYTASRLDEKTYGLFLGPCLNAPGRLGDAKVALRLLLTDDASVAKKLAKRCFDLNERRKRIQHPLTERALAAAETKKKSKVILLADKKCHPGVGGIVASDVKEAFNRPTIIASWQKSENADGGFWKASGRSTEPYNMGEIIQAAVAKKLIESGGGHQMAGGFSFTESQRDKLEHWLNENSGLDETHFVRKVEIVAPAENFDAKTWHGIYRALEPFGNGNPEPSLIAGDVKLTNAPFKLRRSGLDDPNGGNSAAPVLWALRGAFVNGGKPISIECVDLARAEKWKIKGRYDFDLVLTEWRYGKSLIYGFRAKPAKHLKKR